MITTNIDKARDVLNQGKLVAIPTETVYGLAGNAFNETAIHAIFSLKNRPKNNPLIVHIKSLEYLEKVASHIPEKAKLLAEKFWPGPLTMVLPKKPEISDLITAGKDTVAVRMPNHELTLALLNQLDFPLVAPSANPFGSISPTSAAHVLHYFEKELDVILEGGECNIGIESTIIGFEADEVIVYRLGTLPLDEIEAWVGPVKLKNGNNTNPQAPGMQERHYAPNKLSYLTDKVDHFLTMHSLLNVGVIAFQTEIISNRISKQFILSPNGELKEASRNLYKAMHELDLSSVDCIVFETFPQVGLGLTINDKLKRATTQKQ